MAITKQFSNFILRLGHFSGIPYANEYGIQPGGVEDASEGGADGYQYLIVLIGAVSQDAFGFQNSDDLERHTTNPNVMPNRILAIKESVVDARTENRDPPCVAVVIVVEEAASLKAEAAHLYIRRGCPQHHGRHGVAACFYGQRAFSPRHGFFHRSQFPDRFVIFKLEVSGDSADLLPRCGAFDLSRPYHQKVGSHALGLAQHFLLRARANRTSDENRCHTNGHAGEGKRGSHLVRE
jgi:hypothetical protein